MGLLDRFFKKPEELSPDKKTSENPGVSEDLIRQYCRLRYKIESDFSKTNDSDYKRCKTLEAQIKSAHVNVEKRYQKFKRERISMPEKEAEALDVANEIYRKPTVHRKTSTMVTPKEGEEFVTKTRSQVIKADGRAESVSETPILMAACGCRISDDEIKSVCSECKGVICSDHMQRCTGYEGFPCGKLLCPTHTFDFPDEDGTKQPYCFDHHNMKKWYQKSIPDLDVKPEKKPEQVEEDEKDDE